MSIKNNNIAAGIDIGSNSIRLIIAEVENNKIKNIIYQEKATTRLATNINKTGILAEEPFKKSIDVLAGFRKALDKYNVAKIKTVATSAVREARNGEEFIKAAENAGIEISIISGKEEGMLEYLGVCSGFDAGSHPLILDVGGGSSEIIYMQENNELHTESHKIGVVKMADMFDFQNGNNENLEINQNINYNPDNTLNNNQNINYNPNNNLNNNQNISYDMNQGLQCPNCGRELLGNPETCPYCNMRFR